MHDNSYEVPDVKIHVVTLGKVLMDSTKSTAPDLQYDSEVDPW